MRIFVVSDTHDCPESELELIAKEAKLRECECIIHAGDLVDEHFGSLALGNLPIWVIRTRENENLSEDALKNLRPNWHVLEDRDDQVIEFGTKRKIKIYIYHYLGLDMLMTNLGIPSPDVQLEEEGREIKNRFGFTAFKHFRKKFLGWFVRNKKWPNSQAFKLVGDLRSNHDGIQYAIFGHSHHQFFHVNFDLALINPGAFTLGFDDKPKRSYAIIDTKTWDVIFSKIIL